MGPRGLGTKRKRSSESGSNIVCFLHDGDAGASSTNEFISLDHERDDEDEDILEKLKKVRDERLQEDEDSSYRLETICKQIPESCNAIDWSVTGYHKPCYKAFMRNLSRLKSRKQAPPSTPVRQPKYSPRKKPSPTKGSPLSPENRLFKKKVYSARRFRKRKRIASPFQILEVE